MKLTQHELKIFMNDKYREKALNFMTVEEFVKLIDGDIE